MPYNFAADSFHTKKLCSRLSSSEVRFLRKSVVLRSSDPLGGRTRTTIILWFIGKRLVDFLLALIALFSLGVTTEALRAIIGSKSAILLKRRPVDPKFEVEGFAPTNHSSSQKTRLNVLSYSI